FVSYQLPLDLTLILIYKQTAQSLITLSDIYYLRSFSSSINSSLFICSYPSISSSAAFCRKSCSGQSLKGISSDPGFSSCESSADPSLINSSCGSSSLEDRLLSDISSPLKC